MREKQSMENSVNSTTGQWTPQRELTLCVNSTQAHGKTRDKTSTELGKGLESGDRTPSQKTQKVQLIPLKVKKMLLEMLFESVETVEDCR